MESLVDVHAAVEQLWNTDNILILGDMNCDCSYASATARVGLTLRTDTRFTWLIDDDVDTTTISNDCAYDRCVCSIITHSSVQLLNLSFAESCIKNYGRCDDA